MRLSQDLDNSLYTIDIANILRSYRLPNTLVVDVIEYEEHLALRLYRDNFEAFDGTDKEYIAKKIGAAVNKVRSLGCPMYLEVEARVPR